MIRLKFYLILVLIALAAPLHAFKIYGFNFTNWPNSYDSQEAEISLREMVKVKARWVVLVPAWYMETPQSNSFVEGEHTAKTDALAILVKKAKALGFKVALKPHLNVLTGSFRGFIEPSDPNKWFESYQRFISAYADFASKAGIDLLVIGTELATMTGPSYKNYWEQIVGDVRKRYRGPITYAAYWTEWEQVSFWKGLDLIGIDAYFPMGLPGSANTAGKLAQVWQSSYLPKLKAKASSLNKPVLFTELGASSQRYSYVVPWVYQEYSQPDAKGQALYLAGFLEAFKNESSWFAGFFLWNWTTDPKAGGMNDHSHTVQNKPAQTLLRQYFKKLKN